MDKYNTEIFKAYDIRGIIDKDFSNSVVYKIGRAFVKLNGKDAILKYVINTLKRKRLLIAKSKHRNQK